MREKMEGRWRDLPSDIFGIVIKRLSASDDIMSPRRVRAVCSSWRSSVPCPKTHLSPIEIPFPVEPDPGERPMPPYVLTRRKLLALSPIQGANKNNNAGSTSTPPITPWIILVEETEPNKWSLLDPNSGRSKSFFPKSELPDHINVLDYKVTEISHSYHLGSELRCISQTRYGYRPKDMDSKMADKVVSSGYDRDILKVVAVTMQPDSGDFTVFVLFDVSSVAPYSRNLAFWNANQNCWTSVQMKTYNPVDIVNYKGEVYGIESTGRLVRFDAGNSTLVEAAPGHLEHRSGMSYLVEFKDHLYLVNPRVLIQRGSLYQSYIEVKVFILNEEAGSWDRAFDVGGGVFFVGGYDVLSVSAKDVGLPNENSVYVEGFSKYDSVSQCKRQCSFLCKLQSDRPSVIRWWPDRAPFWPPPNWLKERVPVSDSQLK